MLIFNIVLLLNTIMFILELVIDLFVKYSGTAVFRGNPRLDYAKRDAMYKPFVVCKFVAMVIPGHDVHQKDVLGFGVEPYDFDFVTGEHPPAGKHSGGTHSKLTFTHEKNGLYN